jgi:hypothetical protein
MRSKLFVLLSLAVAACTQSSPLRVINADEGSVSPYDIGPPPVMGGMSATPYEGTIDLDYPGVAPDAVPVDDGGAVGVGESVVLVSSAPGGTYCAGGTMQGSCCVTLGFPDPAFVLRSAGDMTITNVSATGAHASHGAWDPDTGYSWLPPSAYAIGDTMRVSAAGDTIDAFTATAAIPAPLVGLPGEFRSSNWGMLGVMRTNNWTFQWTPAGAAFVDISVTGDLGETRCRVSDARGAFAIPAAVLETIASAGGTGTATVYRGNSAAITSPNLTGELEVTISRSYVDLQF